MGYKCDNVIVWLNFYWKYRICLISKVLNICLQFLIDSMDDSENAIWGTAWETDGHIIRDSYLDTSDRIN